MADNPCKKHGISEVEWVQDGTAKCPSHSLLASVVENKEYAQFNGIVSGVVQFRVDGDWRLGTAICRNGEMDAAQCACGPNSLLSVSLHPHQKGTLHDLKSSDKVSHSKGCEGPAFPGVPVNIAPEVPCCSGGRAPDANCGYTWCDAQHKCIGPAESCREGDARNDGIPFK